jgi:hypothetical protein
MAAQTEKCRHSRLLVAQNEEGLQIKMHKVASIPRGCETVGRNKSRWDGGTLSVNSVEQAVS